MKRPRRSQIQAALSPALIAAIESLEMEQSAITLVRTVRALIHIAFDLAEAGDAPPLVMIEQVHRVVRRRLPRLRSGPPVLVMKEGKA